MQLIRKLLYIPIVVLLIGTLLSIFDIMHFGVRLPVGVHTIAIVAGIALVGWFIFDMSATATTYEHPEPEEPPRSTKIIYPRALEESVEALNEAEEFLVKANGRVEIEIDFEEEDHPEEE